MISDLGARSLRGSADRALVERLARAAASASSARSPTRSARSSTSRSADARRRGPARRLAFPLGVGAQGAFLERGFDVGAHLGQRRAARRGQRAAGGPRRGPARRPRPGDAADAHGARPERPARARPAHLRDGRQPGDAGLGDRRCSPPPCCCRPSWPPVDAFARARRRRVAVRRGCAGWRSGSCPFLAALALAELLALAGATPDPPAAPVAPAANPLDGPALAVLAGVCVAARPSRLAGAALRRGARREPGRPRRARRGRGAGAGRGRELAAALAGQPVRGADGGARGAPLDARHAQRAAAAAARSRGAGGARPAAAPARGALLPVRAVASTRSRAPGTCCCS